MQKGLGLAAGLLLLMVAAPASAFTPPYTVTITWGSAALGTTATVTVVDSLGATVFATTPQNLLIFPPYLSRAEILEQLRSLIREQVKPLVRTFPPPPTGTDTFTIGANP